MDSQALHKVVNRRLLPGCFLLILSLSLLLAGDWTWSSIFFAVFKSALGTAVAWFFFLMAGDAIVKSIAGSVMHLGHLREEGGLLVHFLKGRTGKGVSVNPRAAKKTKETQKPQAPQ